MEIYLLYPKNGVTTEIKRVKRNDQVQFKTNTIQIVTQYLFYSKKYINIFTIFLVSFYFSFF